MDFGATFDLAVSVDEISSIVVMDKRKEPKNMLFYVLTFGNGEMVTIPGHLRIYTKNGPNVKIDDKERAKNFIRSLESCTNIQGAYADDLERQIDEEF